MEKETPPTPISLQLPSIPLSSLSQAAKDYLIAKANQDGVTPTSAMLGILDAAASRAGFKPRKPSNPPAAALAS